MSKLSAVESRIEAFDWSLEMAEHLKPFKSRLNSDCSVLQDVRQAKDLEVKVNIL